MLKLICSGLLIGGLAWGLVRLRDAVLDYADDIDWDGQ